MVAKLTTTPAINSRKKKGPRPFNNPPLESAEEDREGGEEIGSAAAEEEDAVLRGVNTVVGRNLLTVLIEEVCLLLIGKT